MPLETNPTPAEQAEPAGTARLESLVRSLIARFPAGARKPTDVHTLWVSEAELAEHIPYTVREIRSMRRRGLLRAYPDLRPGMSRVLYNLFEVSAQIRASRQTQPANLVEFDPESVQVAI